MSESKQYTGIIRTLPYFGGIEKGESKNVMRSRAYRRMIGSFMMMQRNDSTVVYIAMAQKPVIEVLHCYILCGGKIRVRANISHYIAGADIGAVECWDDSVRDCKWWAVLTAPVSWPNEPIPRRGFQGFRYTEAALVMKSTTEKPE